MGSGEASVVIRSGILTFPFASARLPTALASPQRAGGSRPSAPLWAS
jgi:hypothetical protein